MKVVLLLSVVIGTDDPHGGVAHVWALKTNMTPQACETLKARLAPAYAYMGPAATLECATDHAPDWAE